MGLNQVEEKHIQFLCHLWQPDASSVRPQAEMLSSPKVSWEAAKLSGKTRLLLQGSEDCSGEFSQSAFSVMNF